MTAEELLMEWIIKVISAVATFTDAYFSTELPGETWEAFVITCQEWIKVAYDTWIFIIDYIGGTL